MAARGVLAGASDDREVISVPAGGRGRKGSADLEAAVKTAVINKRAGGMGLISGRKDFQKPMAEGVA